MSDYIVKKDGLELLIEANQERVRADVIGQYIAARKKKHLTQADIADALGIKRPNITRFENGSYNPTLDMLVKIAACMDMEVEVTLKEKKKTK